MIQSLPRYNLFSFSTVHDTRLIYLFVSPVFIWMFPGDVWWLAPLSRRPCFLFIIMIILSAFARETIFVCPTFSCGRLICFIVCVFCFKSNWNNSAGGEFNLNCQFIDLLRATLSMQYLVFVGAFTMLWNMFYCWSGEITYPYRSDSFNCPYLVSLTGLFEILGCIQ